MNFNRKHKFLKAVYNLHVDFNNANKENFGEFQAGHSYYIQKYNNKDQSVSYESVREFLTDEIETGLKSHLEKTLQIDIYEIKVTGMYEGSIEIIFSVLFNAYQFVAGLKDFYDSVKLIRNHTDKRISQKLNEKYGKSFTVKVGCDYPSTDTYYKDELFMFQRKGKFPFLQNIETETNKRDGLFYYLLISNIILTIIVLLLVYKAVINYYN